MRNTDRNKAIWSLVELLDYINATYKKKYKLYQLEYALKRSGKIDREKYRVTKKRYYFTEEDAKYIYTVMKETVRKFRNRPGYDTHN